MSFMLNAVRCLAGVGLLVFLLWTTTHASEGPEYISSTGVATTFGSAVAVNGLSFLLDRSDTAGALVQSPLPGEEALVRWLGGTYQPNKRNFLDDDIGAVYTPFVFGLFLTSADLAWPGADRNKQTGQDLYLYTCGLAVTKGITGIFKGLLRRPRPLIVLEPNKAALREDVGRRDDYRSFFSGHASSAFFSATFLNLRLRSIMRRELTHDEYRHWRWAPPALLFGWSSFVGLSRIQAYKHYPSDVIVGSVAGWLLAELFYEIGNNEQADATPLVQGGYYFTLRFSF